MAVEVTTQQIREKILGLGTPPDGLGLTQNLFHQSFAHMFGHGESGHIFHLIRDFDPDDDVGNQVSMMLDFVYERCFGPLLALNYHELEGERTGKALDLWQAIIRLVKWQVDLGRNLVVGAESVAWGRLMDQLQAGLPEKLRIELPGWTDPVDIIGARDMLFQNPKTGSWFGVSLVQHKPQQRELEACLSYILVNRINEPASVLLGKGIHLVSFIPKFKPSSYSGQDLSPVFPRLLKIVGQAAGVMTV